MAATWAWSVAKAPLSGGSAVAGSRMAPRAAVDAGAECTFFPSVAWVVPTVAGVA